MHLFQFTTTVLELLKTLLVLKLNKYNNKIIFKYVVMIQALNLQKCRVEEAFLQ